MTDNTWRERYLGLAKTISKWSKDPSSKIGAVLVRPDKTIAGVGFNGLAPGVNDTKLYDRDFKLASVIHAEENAILSSRDPDMKGYTLYVWGLAPCSHCVGVALRKGIKHFVAVQTKERADWQVNFGYAKRQCDEVGAKYELTTAFSDAAPPIRA
jgi:dCMP deaminase